MLMLPRWIFELSIRVILVYDIVSCCLLQVAIVFCLTRLQVSWQFVTQRRRYFCLHACLGIKTEMSRRENLHDSNRLKIGVVVVNVNVSVDNFSD